MFKCEPLLREISTTDWSHYATGAKMVGDSSPSVLQVSMIVSEAARRCADPDRGLPSIFFRSFCDKVS